MKMEGGMEVKRGVIEMEWKGVDLFCDLKCNVM
jgi:hypothetical protein